LLPKKGKRNSNEWSSLFLLFVCLVTKALFNILCNILVAVCEFDAKESHMTSFYDDEWELPQIVDWFVDYWPMSSEYAYHPMQMPCAPAYPACSPDCFPRRTSRICPPSVCYPRRICRPRTFCAPTICTPNVSCVPRTCHPRYKCPSRRRP
jgi:hypothetical protein